MRMAFLFPALALLAAGLPAAARAAAVPPRTTVTFDHPEKFTDVKDSSFPSDRGRDGILRDINDYIVQRAERLLPPGFHFAITFTDIDLAGEFEPWRGPQWDNVRIVKDMYPPRFKFSYQVTDPAGKVVRQGNENIQDLDFQMQPMIDRQDPLKYEKACLDRWLRDHLSHLQG